MVLEYVGNIKAWDIFNAVSKAEIVTKRSYRESVNYYNCPCSFDIETSSWMENGNEKATMYLWALDLNGLCFYGRTWKEFTDICDIISKALNLDDHKRLAIYVHNLAYEFQWLQHKFEWVTVFAREPRKPMKALTTTGIEFRCSYVLSGYSLSKVADNLIDHKIEKLMGQLDYQQIRTSETPITDLEMEYMRNDVLIVEYFIAEEIARNGDIAHIPMTATSYVRRTLRNHAYPPGTYPKVTAYYDKISRMKIQSPEEYKALMRAFSGGFTHASPYHVEQVIHNVSSIDFNSSYPAVMVNYKYPMGSGVFRKHPSGEWIENAFKDFCCIADFQFFNLRPRVMWDNPISLSKCWQHRNVEVDNGRVVSAESINITATNVDFEVWEQFYIWDDVIITNVYKYCKDYLPKEFIQTVKELYDFKTTLKGVECKEAEYMHSKWQLNSMYGMTVTNIVSDEVEFTDTWKCEPVNIEEKLKEYNDSTYRTLFYPWGVFVTAYARRNLFYGILEFGGDYIYSDTDSIKCLNYERHKEYINRYNAECIELSRKCARRYGLGDDAFSPKTIKGIEKPLGIWDFEGTMDSFKCLGAKRYMTETNGSYSLTVAGLNKKTAMDYIIQQKDPFTFFDDEMYIPAEYSGKLIHTYIDFPQSGTVTDYLGNISYWEEDTSCHLRPGHYSLKISAEFKEFLEKMQIGLDKRIHTEYSI